MRKLNFAFLFIVFSCACTQSQTQYLPESTVLKIMEAKYDTLRTLLKDSLAQGIKNINDYSNAFSAEEKFRLDSLIEDFKKQKGLRIVVFSFDSLMTSMDSVYEVTQIAGTKNRINTTIGFSLTYRAIYIWNDSLINNSVLNQHETKTIIDEKFIPPFRKGDYFKGTFEGIAAIIQRISINSRN
ncbi:TPM domain-containing protein [Pollutibacter soli]|uniref:TPM domain-containing protein n=1 Tax=Pollutibacter soli TaxID=3034157 RepID=UPI0030137571